MKKNLLITAFSLFSILIFAQEKQGKAKVAIVGFYNIENLYDTENDPTKDDEEFLPDGKNKWTQDRYLAKLERMSDVISKLGGEIVKSGPTVLGLCEVENKKVVEELVGQPALKKWDYGVVHYDCRYNRGVDVAFCYQKARFKVSNSKSYPLYSPEDTSFTTRDQLLVSGMLDGEEMHFIVNHWPSRRGGEKRSAPMRELAAKLCRSIVDSIYKINENAKIIIMGDLNDDPTDASVYKHLGAIGNKDKVEKNGLFNAMYKLFKDGIGSLAYKDSWNLFDQIIVSGNLLGDDKSTYKFLKARVFNEKFLMQKEGNFAGYPFRTYVGDVYQGGFSDHFPVYVFLTKEIK
ncbi:MAG: hypothetical protein A2275_11530 [Bacteroidetes bacterium RIFOXYA12_FULL_35_11]|nr:MAG: hypothetical protein A2X01_18925 [Bacteroidetes bacterium GWF2_35_48]OFY72577.1 MAG: hypothetical protein A2275_11530 [Bacteroidetes bacterium RIFOXYA12_FULL_35_11]OFY95691.1 MAG: hypothetical protein A2491_08775 [Bacteroidetes bacterium RIFOXYC12_FULL_35_7]HBX49557.1 endonuclease [Bacteroidales bacterium]